MTYTSIFTSIIDSYLPEPHASLLNGILFGIPLESKSIFYQQVKVTGLLHIIVLSGTNITLLAVMIGALTSFISKKASLIVTIATIIIFIWFVGPAPPIIRAGVMGVLSHISLLYRRSTIALLLLFLSAVFTGIIWPHWLSTVSFQLSYGATLGLILLKSPKQAHSSPLLAELWPSLAASVFTVPIIFIYFREISLVAPLANLAISFVIGPLMMIGFLTAFLGRIHFALGIIPAYLSYVMLSYMIYIIQTISSIPYIFFKF